MTSSLSTLARVCWISGSPGTDIFPASLPWQQLARNLALMWRCLSEDALMDRLPEAQLEVLARKCPGYRPGGGFQVTWSQFQGVALAPHSFSLWEWFYAAIELVRGHLLGPWKKGLIAGFLARQEAEQLVGGQAQGTFLLRFSDSTPGSLSLVYRGPHGPVSLAPFTAKDLARRNIADRIFDLGMQITLIVVHPNRPVYDWAEFRQKEEKATIGYCSMTTTMTLEKEYPNKPEDNKQSKSCPPSPPSLPLPDPPNDV